MANSPQITVLNSASVTATVSTLDGFRDGVGTATMLVGNVTASLLNATVTGLVTLSGNSSGIITTGTAGTASTQVLSVQGILGMVGLNVINSTASLLNATVTGTTVISGTVTVANSTASNLNANVSGSIGLIPQTSGGLSLSSTILTTTAVNTTIVKGSAGQLYHISCTNNTATIAYVKFYNATTNTAFTTLTPVWRTMIPGASSGGAGIVNEATNGLAFATGITFAVTGGIADTDTTTLNANALIINLGYK